MNEERARSIAKNDIDVLLQKERTYQGSWKKRGGVGAFMMLARKWDRLENICRDMGWDVFSAARSGSGDESAIEQIRDLRRYLLLVEEELSLTDDKDITPKKEAGEFARRALRT